MERTGLRVVETIPADHFKRALSILPNHLNDIRAKMIYYHTHTTSVNLIGTPKDQKDIAYYSLHGPHSVITPEAYFFPEVIEWMRAFAGRRKGFLSRAQIVRLNPKSEVYLHEDWGLYYALRDRYHLVMESEGSHMIAGDEEAVFRTGDVFFYPNKVMHGAKNPSAAPRTHLIFDVLPKNKLVILWRFIYFVFFLKRKQVSEKFPLLPLSTDIENLIQVLKRRDFIVL